MDDLYEMDNYLYEQDEQLCMEITAEGPDWIDREEALIESAILDTPALDYYDSYRPQLPKKEVAQYIADCGLLTPLVESDDEWAATVDAGEAMIRSELAQDYDGLSGLLSSKRVGYDFLKQTSDYRQQLHKLLWDGLRNSDLSPGEFMRHESGYWFLQATRITEKSHAFGLPVTNVLASAGASRWRYITGENITVFADPNVAGRYHFGVRQLDENRSGKHLGPVGSYTFDADEYDTPKQFRKHHEPFIAHPYVEMYEQVRSLPRFDQTNCPVLELQNDLEGNLHFLQYLKTPQKVNHVESFDLPNDNDSLLLTNVRGATPESGKSLRLYLNPEVFLPEMENQALYLNLLNPGRLETQLASMHSDFMLHRAYVSFQDNHFDSSPLIRPPLAAGLDGGEAKKPLQGWVDQVLGRLANQLNPNAYVDMHVTANGRQAVIESDWLIKEH